MFDKEIIQLKQELNALKANKNKAISRDAVFIKSDTATCGVDANGLVDSVNVQIIYKSVEVPPFMICIDRVSGDELYRLEHATHLTTENNTIEETIVLQETVSNNNGHTPITVRITAYCLVDFTLKVKVNKFS